MAMLKVVCAWGCWQQDGQSIMDLCNEAGTASVTSCSTKDVNSLDDCNVDDKGTSCGAWALYEGNMIYLDAKEVNW